MLRYSFLFYEILYNNESIKVKPVSFNSFDHDNYKKDRFVKNKKGNYNYGKKRRYYTDYC